jgi:hypothetical protein
VLELELDVELLLFVVAAAAAAAAAAAVAAAATGQPERGAVAAYERVLAERADPAADHGDKCGLLCQ